MALRDTVLLNREPLHKELILLRENSLRNFQIEKLFMIANNEELGSGFHSIAAKIRLDWLLYLCQVFH